MFVLHIDKKFKFHKRCRVNEIKVCWARNVMRCWRDSGCLISHSKWSGQALFSFFFSTFFSSVTQWQWKNPLTAPEQDELWIICRRSWLHRVIYDVETRKNNSKDGREEENFVRRTEIKFDCFVNYWAAASSVKKKILKCLWMSDCLALGFWFRFASIHSCNAARCATKIIKVMSVRELKIEEKCFEYTNWIHEAQPPVKSSRNRIKLSESTFNDCDGPWRARLGSVHCSAGFFWMSFDFKQQTSALYRPTEKASENRRRVSDEITR